MFLIEQFIVFLSIVQMMGGYIRHHKVYLLIFPCTFQIFTNQFKLFM